MMKARLLAAALCLALAAPTAHAGPFDCAVVYDEFESLMNKNFLVKPDSYVPMAWDSLSFEEYSEKQKGKLMLRPGRQGWGAAVVRTNANASGKFLFAFDGGPGDLRGSPLLIIRDITLVNKVEDGSGQRIFREVRVSAQQGVDLDQGRIDEGDAVDLLFKNVDGKLSIESTNNAVIAFPLASLCK
ncbi:MAG: hypothetical protein VX871_10140 [Pseudomonadota bacterium]|nr:hypothetical protein [Pseudomonadota bacterium]